MSELIETQPQPYIQNEPTPPIPSEPQRTNKLVVPLLVGIVIVLLGTTTFLAYQYFNKPAETTSDVSRPQAASTSDVSDAPSDSTPTWKTYTDPVNGFSFRYPPDYSMGNYSSSDPSTPKLLNNRIDWTISTFRADECKGDCPGITKKTTKTINADIVASRYEGLIGEIGGNIPQSFLSYEVVLPSGKYLNIILWELLRGKAAIVENYSPNRNPQPINTNDVKIFDQILSTFEFIEPSPIPDSVKTFSNTEIGIKFDYPSSLTLDPNQSPRFYKGFPDNSQWIIVLTTNNDEKINIQSGGPADWPDCKIRLAKKNYTNNGFSINYFKETDARDCGNMDISSQTPFNSIGWYGYITRNNQEWFISLGTSDFSESNQKSLESIFLNLVNSFKVIE